MVRRLSARLRVLLLRRCAQVLLEAGSLTEAPTPQQRNKFLRLAHSIEDKLESGALNGPISR